MVLEAIVYDEKNGTLQLLDQLLLPHETKYISINSCEDAWNAIRKMQVRGAPAIAIAGLLSLAVEIINNKHCDAIPSGGTVNQTDAIKSFLKYLKEKCDYLCTARPTAVNIKRECDRLIQHVTDHINTPCELAMLQRHTLTFIGDLRQEDLTTNQSIGREGGEHILRRNQKNKNKLSILTHCNTGSLATTGYGTALGVIRYLHSIGKIDTVYCTETRPYNQGSRLTAYELVSEKIPGKLITDSMAAFAMAKGKIDVVITGADRVVSNGDTANKIGTYSLAVNAKHHNVPFYIAAPRSTIDFNLATGDEIVIEERPANELTTLAGVKLAPDSIDVWNPSFDVTPSNLITGIITEFGVFAPQTLNSLASKP